MDWRQTQSNLLESSLKTMALDGQVGVGTLPPAARDALDSYSAWAKTEVDRAMARVNVTE